MTRQMHDRAMANGPEGDPDLQRRRLCSGVLGGAITFALTGCHRSLGAEPPGAGSIPLIAGLTLLHAVSEADGDYEPICRVIEVDPDEYRVALSADLPPRDGRKAASVRVERRVLMRDHREARATRGIFSESDGEVFPGTTLQVSALTLHELRTAGRSGILWLSWNDDASFAAVDRFRGDLVLRSQGYAELPVNGRSMRLPVVEAAGRLLDGDVPCDLAVQILEDPQNPLILRNASQAGTSRVVRIDFPTAEPRRAQLERTLAQQRKADVYGIYFSFGSATLRPESTPVLEDIAALLRGNAEWRLRIGGHTDSIGDAVRNLSLSQRRAAAVKDALVDRHGVAASRLATTGFGEAAPKATNDTAEGRALNRRVELVRV